MSQIEEYIQKNVEHNANRRSKISLSMAMQCLYNDMGPKHVINIEFNNIHFMNATYPKITSVYISNDINEEYLDIRSDSMPYIYILKDLGEFLKHFPNVKEFIVSNCYLPKNTIDATLFRNSPNLRRISITNCFIQKIHKNAFSKLNYVYHIDVSNNNLRKFHRETFENETLRELILSYNKIYALTQSLFNSINHIHSVYIDCYTLQKGLNLNLAGIQFLDLRTITRTLPCTITLKPSACIRFSVNNDLVVLDSIRLTNSIQKAGCKRVSRLICDELAGFLI